MTYFLDLFAGIGGFALGAHWAGLTFDAHYFSEVDPYAIRVYSARFPDALPLGDIRAIRGTDLPVGDWIIAGGFPCQDISYAGRGAGLEGERSGLWFEMLRLVRDLRPKYLVVENVAALLGRGVDTVLGSLAEIGYDAEWSCVSACSMGTPHARERLFILAYPHSITGAPRMGSRRRITDDDRPQEMRGLERRECAERYFAVRLEEQRESDGVPHGVPARVDRLKCLGNSIVPQIAEMIFQQPAFDEWRPA